VTIRNQDLERDAAPRNTIGQMKAHAKDEDRPVNSQ